MAGRNCTLTLNRLAKQAAAAAEVQRAWLAERANLPPGGLADRARWQVYTAALERLLPGLPPGFAEAAAQAAGGWSLPASPALQAWLERLPGLAPALTCSAAETASCLLEQFLAACDQTMRRHRGVYFTPPALVDFTLRGAIWLAGELASVRLLDPAAGAGAFLRSAGEHERELASVRLLDPAAGAGAFLRGVLRLGGAGMLPRLRGLELAPLNLWAGRLLTWLELQAIAPGTPLEAIQLVEADALQPGAHPPADPPWNLVVGNPPYAAHSANASPWMDALLEDYRRVDGQPLAERGAKWLRDDYVQFFRLGQHLVERAGSGVLALVTNHGYLDAFTFRGMRASLLNAFDDIYLLDLGGNLKRDRLPGDENLFPIQQGVAVGWLARRAERRSTPQVRYFRLVGSRQAKLDWLAETPFTAVPWQEVNPRPPAYAFTPAPPAAANHEAHHAAYQAGWSLDQIFPVHAPGIITGFDRLLVGFERSEVERRAACLADASYPLERLLAELGEGSLRGQRPRQEQSLLERLAGLRRRLLEANPAAGEVIPLLYRPFDVRWLWAHPALLERGRWRVTQAMVGGQNLGLAFSRFTRGAPFRDALASRLPVEFGVLASRVSNRCSLAPLYLDPAARSAPNLTPAFLADLNQRVGFEPCPEDVFGWLYALLWSPAFRQRYAAWLGQNFPRLPLPHSREAFLALARLGRLLIDWHTLPPPPLAPAPSGEDLLIGSYRALEHYQAARRRARHPLAEADTKAVAWIQSAAAASRSLQAEIDQAVMDYAIL